MKRCETCNILGGDNQYACYADGEPLVDDPLATALQEAIGEKYYLTKLIGKGAMGAVYGAHHRDLGDVAIKVMLGSGDNQSLSERFLREARSLRKLRHQNAVLVYDLERSRNGVTYMVMEMIAGSNLGEDLRERKRLTLDETMEIADAVCDALAAAHERGIIHRDLKPDNILRAEEAGLDGRTIRTIKIADFGIVKQRGGDDDEMQITKSGKPIGTPFYMSPEQWFGDGPGAAALDHRTDIYALGCTLYELLSGRPPFIARTTEELRRQHLHDEPPLLHTLASHVPVPVSRVIMRALSKDREDRQQTATQFLEELRAAYDESFQGTNQRIEKRLRSTQESPLDEREARPVPLKPHTTEESVPMFLPKVTALDAVAPDAPEQEHEASAAAPTPAVPPSPVPPSPAVSEAVTMRSPQPADSIASIAAPPVQPSPPLPSPLMESHSHPLAYSPTPIVYPAPMRPAADMPPRRRLILISLTVFFLFGTGVAIGIAVYRLRYPTVETTTNLSPPQQPFNPPQIPMGALTGTLRVNAAPGSEVFIDDEKAGVVGADGLFSMQVPVGLRNVRVAAKNFRLWMKDARIKANQKTTLNAARERPSEVKEATADERQQRARDADDKKDDDATEAEYRALLKDDPNNAAAHLRLGRLLNQQQRYTEAIAELEAAARLDAKDTESRIALVKLYLLKARDPEAEATARQLHQLRPRDPAVRHLLARALLRDPAKLDEALEEIQSAIVSKESPEFLETKAYVLLARGALDEALDAAQRAVELDRSKNPAYRAAVAVVLSRMERMDEAVSTYKEVRQSDKSDRWGDIKRLELTRGYSKPVLEALAALIARTN